MGAQQAFQWGVSYPNFMEKIVGMLVIINKDRVLGVVLVFVVDMVGVILLIDVMGK